MPNTRAFQIGSSISKLGCPVDTKPVVSLVWLIASTKDNTHRDVHVVHEITFYGPNESVHRMCTYVTVHAVKFTPRR